MRTYKTLIIPSDKNVAEYLNANLTENDHVIAIEPEYYKSDYSSRIYVTDHTVHYYTETSDTIK